MAQRQAADFAGHQRQEGVHVLGVELLGLHELPVHRPQALAQLGEALAGEALDGFAGGGELAPVGAVARGLHREHEARRRLVMPLLPARRLEGGVVGAVRSEEHTSELQSLMRISYAVFCLKKKNKKNYIKYTK